MNRGLRPNASHVYFHYRTGQTVDFAFGMGAIKQGYSAVKNSLGQGFNGVKQNVTDKVLNTGAKVLNKGMQVGVNNAEGTIKNAIGNKIANAGQAVIDNRENISKGILGVGAAGVVGVGGLTAAQLAKKKRDEQMGMQ